VFMMKWIESLFSFNEGLIIWMTMIYFLGNLWFYFSERKQRWEWMFLFSAMYILLSRLFDFEYWWSNPDTGQWIICAKSMVDSPESWWNEYSLFDFTRLLTIVPIALVYMVKGSVTYFDAQMVFWFFLFLFVYLQYRLMWLIFERKSVNLAMALFVAFFTMSSHYDYRVYNSEVVCIVLITAAIWSFVTVQRTNKGWLGLGFLLSIIPFAKEQAAFIAIASFVFVFIVALFSKQYRKVILLLLGSFFGGVLFFLLILTNHGFEKTRWFLFILFQYSNSGMKAGYVPFSVKAYKFVQLILLNREMLIFFPLTLLGLCIAVIYQKRWNTSNLGFRPIFQLYALLFVVTSYSLFSAGNVFIHYTIFMWPLIIFYFVFFIEWLALFKKRLLWLSFTPLLMFIFLDLRNHTMRLWRDEPRCIRDSQKWWDDPMVQALKKCNAYNASMLIWGWDVVVPIVFNSARVSGYLYPQFAFGNYESAGSVRGYYIDVLMRKSPEYFVEIVGQGRRFFKDQELYGVQQSFPELEKILQIHYHLLSSSTNYKIYKHN
jgi:hypothetical protein